MIEELINKLLEFKKDGKPMFKALMLHSNGRWTADHRTWNKEKQKFSTWGDSPHEVLEKLLDKLKELPQDPIL